ncbi:MAG TPA: thioesterase family protein [Nitrospiria bacterium]
MNLWFRVIKVLLFAMLRKPLGPLEESVITLRVWPNDLDVNGHMNNGRYLTLMDLGRLDLMFRNGLGGLMVRGRWAPIVGTAMIRFRRSLNPLDRFTLRTRLLAWDDKWFFLEQRFDRNGDSVALGWIKGLFRNRDGNIPPPEILRRLGYTTASPEMPEAVRAWFQSESKMSWAGRPESE